MQYEPEGPWYDYRAYPSEPLTRRMFHREQRRQDVLSPAKVFRLVHRTITDEVIAEPTLIPPT